MLGRRKARHIIHRDGFPRLFRSRKKGVQEVLLNGWFNKDAGGARPDILANILSNIWTIKILL